MNNYKCSSKKNFSITDAAFKGSAAALICMPLGIIIYATHSSPLIPIGFLVGGFLIGVFISYFDD
jgi:hypothetical protein